MRHAGKLLRALISVALLAWLLAQVDLGDLRRILVTAEIHWLLIVHLLTPLTLACGVAKWWLLLRARYVELSPGALSRYYLIGMFWNNFLPSNSEATSSGRCSPSTGPGVPPGRWWRARSRSSG